jgi:hypothetical protein
MKSIKLVLVSALMLTTLAIPAQANEPSCAEGGKCAVGDLGPGGGYVIYVSAKPKKWGQYIEVAPDGWFRGRTDPNIEPFCYQRPDSRDDLVQTSTKIGSGFTNTKKLLKICKDGAAATARSYRGGGFKNWSLPSKDELNEAVFEAFGVNITFAHRTAWYWSSSSTYYGAVSSYYSGLKSWDGSFSSTNDAHVRPVRHFKPTK